MQLVEREIVGVRDQTGVSPTICTAVNFQAHATPAQTTPPHPNPDHPETPLPRNKAAPLTQPSCPPRGQSDHSGSQTRPPAPCTQTACPCCQTSPRSCAAFDVACGCRGGVGVGGVGGTVARWSKGRRLAVWLSCTASCGKATLNRTQPPHPQDTAPPPPTRTAPAGGHIRSMSPTKNIVGAVTW